MPKPARYLATFGAGVASTIILGTVGTFLVAAAVVVAVIVLCASVPDNEAAS